MVARYKDALSYLFFGGLTTILNYLIYFYLLNHLSLSAVASNVFAWCIAVVFAFLTNKPFVFHSNDWRLKTMGPELVGFLCCRIGSGLFETLIIWIFVDMLHMNGNIWKLLTSILVVILNYVASKLLIFRKK